jgi:hypothetical protein
MALIFSPSIGAIYANAAVAQSLSNYGSSIPLITPPLNPTTNYGTESGVQTTSITVYSGVQPTAAQIIANWSAYNNTNSNFLAHYSGVHWGVDPGNANAVILTGTTNPATPINTGVATWAILWCQMDLTPTQLSASTIPTGQFTGSSFFVAPVTDTTGTGIIRYLNTTLTAGTPAPINDAGILINFV